MFKGTMTKWPIQKLTQGTTQILLQHHDATLSSAHALGGVSGVASFITTDEQLQ